MLWMLSRNRARAGREAGWWSALWLFLYAASFSWAYLRLSVGVGAFLLFGTVQATMIGAAVAHGERPRPRTWAGLAIAVGGLAGLTLPGAQAPSFAAAAAMIAAGFSWGAYSLRGRRSRDGIAATADAFIRSAPFAATLWIAALLFGPRAAALSGGGAALAVASGALTSGVGYVLWNTALPHIRLSTAAIMQISVPPLAAVAGIVLLGERPTVRLVLGGGAIVAGVALAIWPRKST
jgi:drug/metabolite transporter (DMT)-like permease